MIIRKQSTIAKSVTTIARVVSEPISAMSLTHYEAF